MDAYRLRQSESWQRYYEKRHLPSISGRGAAFVKRDQQILQMRHAGATLQQIAWEFGMSRGRVWQICAKASRLSD
jgi:DNA-directed RNA polymerase sigma subunit (sigma70/sigma32)